MDKTAMLGELIPVVESRAGDIACRQQGGRDIRYICVTRPRRFGKTVIASMIAPFFGKGEDSREVFEKLDIGRHKEFERYINKYNVVYITFNELPDECTAYRQYIGKIKRRLLKNLKMAFPDAEIDDGDALWDALNNIYEMEDSAEFIFVFAE